MTYADFNAFASAELSTSRDRFVTGVATEGNGQSMQFTACLIAMGRTLVAFGQQGNGKNAKEVLPEGKTAKQIATFLTAGTKINTATVEQYLSNANTLVARGGKRFDQKVSDLARKGDAVALEAWLKDKGGVAALRASWKAKAGKGGDKNKANTRLTRIANMLVKEAKEKNKKLSAVLVQLVRAAGKDCKAEVVALLTKSR